MRSILKEMSLNVQNQETVGFYGGICTGTITVVRGDITRQKVDAIINAANTSLLGGGGVDGAIHRAAGPGLLEECQKLNGCPPGQAKITGGHNLAAKWVIHTVGPVWQGGNNGEEETLARCYRSCLELAQQYSIRTIAVPSISTGAYRFPAKKASMIAILEIGNCLEKITSIQEVIIVCFNQAVYECYLDAQKKSKMGLFKA
jgi:O-acetyl-ADP-ribose deacetylase (regulator of RNase III)